MKTLALLLSFIISFPLMGVEQPADDLLKKVSVALSDGQDDYAVSLFRQSASINADETEMFYLTRVEKNSDVAPRLANELALYYKSQRSYDKAYLFYRELLQYNNHNVAALIGCAEMEMMRGKAKNALEMYEKVLLLDADNLQANIFLGNYFYMMAERDKKRLDDDYKKIVSPTRMQYARYKNSLSEVYSNVYSKAKDYLQRVMQQFPSTEAGVTLGKIEMLELEMK